MKKRLGQHLLVDSAVLDAIEEVAGTRAGDRVLEIGPGPGNLTARLADAVRPQGRVVAIELDRSWASRLNRACSGRPHVKVVWNNALEVDLAALLGEDGPWKCVANIPYYITSPIVQKLLDARRLFSLFALLMQKEVATRLHATSGREVGMLSHFVHYHCETRIAFDVPASAFRPPPTVDSALLVMEPLSAPPVDVPFDSLRPIIQAAFSARRRMLRGTLRALPSMETTDAVDGWLSRAGIHPQARPEQLTLDDFARLAMTRRGAMA